MTRTKRPLRRCTFCQKVGHNRATCQEVVLDTTIKPAPAPLKFFVHHVNYAPTVSPHLVNLKKDFDDIWNQIEPAAPESNPLSLYQTYHQIPTPPTEHLMAQDAAPVQAVVPEPTPATPPPQITPSFSAPQITEPAPVPPALVVRIAPPKKSFKLPRFSNSNFFTRFKQPFLHPTFQRLAIASLILIVAATTLPPAAKSYYTSLQDTKETVTENSLAGFTELEQSLNLLKQGNLAEAETSTNRALDKFNTALSELHTKHEILQTIATSLPIIGTELGSRQKILLAGQEITVGNGFLLSGIKKVQDKQTLPLTDRLHLITTALEEALPNYQKALDNLSAADLSAVPLQYQDQFQKLRTVFAGAVHDFATIVDIGTNLQEIFGGRGLRRYLVVFQNQHEIRPTGGFMGSFAILDVKDGKLVNMTIPPGGSYDVQGQLDAFVEPPAPLLLANKRWEFHDANWFPDFPASAEKTLWFYRRSRKVTADGVIAINASVLERLLSLVGPISDAKRQVTLTADNALSTIQTIVEEGPEKANHKPKQIIADLAPELVDTLTQSKPEQLLPLLINLKDALSQKEIQTYFTDADAEAAARSFGWAGAILPTHAGQDYLFVVNTNIQGQKSDADIKQTITHEAVVDNDGSIVDTVTITREHTGTRGDKLYGETNIDYLRVYVPPGAELVRASGFTWPDENSFKAPEKWYGKDTDLTRLEVETAIDPISGTRITREFDKTAFGNWVITEPGSTSQVQFSYRLPFKVHEQLATNMLNTPLTDYQLILQKQSGITSNFSSQIIFPTNWSPAWHEGIGLTLAKNGATIAPLPLTSDMVWSVLMKKNN